MNNFADKELFGKVEAFSLNLIFIFSEIWHRTTTSDNSFSIWKQEVYHSTYRSARLEPSELILSNFKMIPVGAGHLDASRSLAQSAPSQGYSVNQVQSFQWGNLPWKTRASSVIPGNLSLREKSALLWSDLNMQAEFDFFPYSVINV